VINNLRKINMLKQQQETIKIKSSKLSFKSSGKLMMPTRSSMSKTSRLAFKHRQRSQQQALGIQKRFVSPLDEPLKKKRSIEEIEQRARVITDSIKREEPER
jgi:hypothetical protein